MPHKTIIVDTSDWNIAPGAVRFANPPRHRYEREKLRRDAITDALTFANNTLGAIQTQEQFFELAKNIERYLKTGRIPTDNDNNTGS